MIYEKEISISEAVEMVLLHIKRGEASQFLYETTTIIDIDKLTQEIAAIYNGRLKVQRICAGWVLSFSIVSPSQTTNFCRNGRASKLWLHDAIRNDWTN